MKNRKENIKFIACVNLGTCVFDFFNNFRRVLVDQQQVNAFLKNCHYCLVG